MVDAFLSVEDDGSIRTGGRSADLAQPHVNARANRRGRQHHPVGEFTFRRRNLSAEGARMLIAKQAG